MNTYIVSWLKLNFDYFTNDEFFRSAIRDRIEWLITYNGDDLRIIAVRTCWDIYYIRSVLYGAAPISYKFLRDVAMALNISLNDLTSPFTMSFLDEQYLVETKYPDVGDWDDIL